MEEPEKKDEEPAEESAEEPDKKPEKKEEQLEKTTTIYTPVQFKLSFAASRSSPWESRHAHMSVSRPRLSLQRSNAQTLSFMLAVTAIT